MQNRPNNVLLSKLICSWVLGRNEYVHFCSRFYIAEWLIKLVNDPIKIRSRGWARNSQRFREIKVWTNEWTNIIHRYSRNICNITFWNTNSYFYVISGRRTVHRMVSDTRGVPFLPSGPRSLGEAQRRWSYNFTPISLYVV